MVRCASCQANVEEGRAKCAVCGFPVLQSVLGNREEMENMKKMAAEYRKKKLQGIRIGITVYGYAMEGEELKLDKTEEIFLAQAEELTLGEPIWCAKDFARIDGNETVPMHVGVKKANGEEEFHDLKIKFPRIEGFCHVGIEMKEGFRAEMLLGSGDSFERSEDFALPMNG